MKKMMMVLASAMFVSSMAFAADAENKEDAKMNQHTNPITGTKTVKKTYKHKANDEKGQSADTTVTETTKTKKDGTVKKTVESDSDTTTKTEKH